MHAYLPAKFKYFGSAGVNLKNIKKAPRDFYELYHGENWKYVKTWKSNKADHELVRYAKKPVCFHHEHVRMH